MSITRILLAEDNPADARLVKELLRECWGGDFELLSSKRLDEALRIATTQDVQVMLLDLTLPDSSVLSRIPSMTLAQTAGSAASGLKQQMLSAVIGLPPIA